jgi:hypothetical protein
MQSKGKKLIDELKALILDTMKSIPDCSRDGDGCSYRDIQNSAGLNLDLPAQDGWLTWSVLASLAQDSKVEALRRRRHLYWRIV